MMYTKGNITMNFCGSLTHMLASELVVSADYELVPVDVEEGRTHQLKRFPERSITELN